MLSVTAVTTQNQRARKVLPHNTERYYIRAFADQLFGRKFVLPGAFDLRLRKDCEAGRLQIRAGSV
jgi:hypothetical protein